jgi:hypothetical protein
MKSHDSSIPEVVIQTQQLAMTSPGTEGIRGMYGGTFTDSQNYPFASSLLEFSQRNSQV